jgi:single-strand DNA-binding protein
MPGYLNKAQLIGNLGRDPEIRTTQSGGKVVNLAVATSENWIDKRSGERREQTEWHRVVIFSDGLANIAETYLHKGSKVYVEGSLKTRRWTDQHKQERFTTEIVLQPYSGTLIMLDGANGREGVNEHSAGAAAQNDLDDNIPF